MSNIHGGVLSEVLSFLAPVEIDSCQLVSKKWDRFIRLSEWYLPKRPIDTLEFCSNYDIVLRHGVEHDTSTIQIRGRKRRFLRRAIDTYNIEDENTHLDCTKCIFTGEFWLENAENHGYLLKKYHFERIKMYFLDEVALDLLKNLINLCGQKLHSKKLIFSPIHECKNLKAFKDIILPFFKNLSYLLSQIFVDEIYIDLASEELQFLVENFPLEEMSFIKDKNVHLYMKNGGLSYELSKDCLAKMVYGYQIGFRNSMEMDLSRISNEDFCEIFLKAFKDTNNIEAMPKLINLDGSMKFTDKNFVKFLNNYTGITGRIEGLDELGWEHVLDEIGLEHVYELKRPDFWTLTIEFKLEKIWQGTKLVCEECSKLYTDKKSFAKDFGRSGTWYREDFPIRETISWREHKLREKDRKKSRYWRWDDGLYKWLHYRKDGILELKSFHDYEKMEEYVLKKASFKIFFDSEAYNRSQAKN